MYLPYLPPPCCHEKKSSESWPVWFVNSAIYTRVKVDGTVTMYWIHWFVLSPVLTHLWGFGDGHVPGPMECFGPPKVQDKKKLSIIHPRSFTASLHLKNGVLKEETIRLPIGAPFMSQTSGGYFRWTSGLTNLAGFPSPNPDGKGSGFVERLDVWMFGTTEAFPPNPT